MDDKTADESSENHSIVLTPTTRRHTDVPIARPIAACPSCNSIPDANSAASYSQPQGNRIVAVLQDMAAQWLPANVVTVGYPDELQFSASSATSGARMWLGLISRKLAWSNGA
jgi:hypothetical protein